MLPFQAQPSLRLTAVAWTARGPWDDDDDDMS